MDAKDLTPTSSKEVFYEKIEFGSSHERFEEEEEGEQEETAAVHKNGDNVVFVAAEPNQVLVDVNTANFGLEVAKRIIEESLKDEEEEEEYVEEEKYVEENQYQEPLFLREASKEIVEEEAAEEHVNEELEEEEGEEEAAEEHVNDEQEEEEGEEEDDDTVEDYFRIDAKVEHRKYPFKLKQHEIGNILTIHHTVQEQNKLIRICLAACCFSASGTQFVVIDKRGNIFVFDFAQKCYWRLTEVVPKTTVVRANQKRRNLFLIGTKNGQIHQFDVVKSKVLKTCALSGNAIAEISFVGQPVKPPHLALVHAGDEAILLDVDTLTGTHRLKFEDVHISLKFASYLPLSEMLFTCFTNDSVHVWSSITLNTLRVVYPLKARDRKVRLMGGAANVPKVTLGCSSSTMEDELQFSCQETDYCDGNILSYCYSQELNLLCLATQDNYLILLNRHSMDLHGLLRLNGFRLKQCAFLPKARECLILGLTTEGQVILLDFHNPERRLIVHAKQACRFALAPDTKLLAVMTDMGEAQIWATCRIYNAMKRQEQCLQLLKSAFKESKTPPLGTQGVQRVDEDIKKLLRRDRLVSILKEYGCYPAKYRSLIWCSMLKLPGNRREFQLLLKLNVPTAVKQRSMQLKMKNESLKRYLVKIWSCLAHWCKVFAYSDFLPHLIFPFVKVYARNPLTAFELCATLLMNHFQLWFEFHPLQPSNYLGLCYNVLQHFDAKLCRFYASVDAKPSDFAWSMLSNAFAEVFDEEQWLCLWDNIISAPLYFPIFIVVAYNILQREVIVRLPDLETVRHMFREQNPVDVGQVITKAYDLMAKCPAKLHPKLYIGEFEAIPKNVYPKFLKYPGEWLQRHEADVEALRREQQAIDYRLRELEMEEHKIVQRLEDGLKQEEHAKKVKEMEKLYQDILKREEDRVSCQRKMLILYQREIRNRKGEVIEKMHEAKRRQKTHDMARQMESLVQNIERERVRNDIDLVMAEDELRNQDMRLLEQKYATAGNGQTLDEKYKNEAKRVRDQRDLLKQELKEMNAQNSSESSSIDLDCIERTLNDIQNEFLSLTKS